VVERTSLPVPRRGLQASEHRALLFAGDAAIGGLAVVAAIWIWTITAGVDLPVAVRMRAHWFLAVPIWALGLAPAQSRRVALSIRETVAALFNLAGLLLIGYLAVYFYAPRQALPRLLALYFIWHALFLTLGWRLVYIYVFTETSLRRRAVIIGAGPTGERILEVMQTGPVRDTFVVGFVDAEVRGPSKLGPYEATAVCSVIPAPILGGFARLREIVHAEGISEIILAVSDAPPMLLEQLVACQEAGVDVVRMATVYEHALQRLPVDHLEPNWLFNSYADAVRAKDSSRMAKRLADLVGGVAGALLFCLLTPFIAFAIWLERGRPVFYRQVRVGRGGRLFQMFKFRTMVVNAEQEGEARWAARGDPRVTRVGRFLRRARLDELPNFLNVLRGDLSLVGPRAERPEFVERLQHEIPFYRARLIVRPGLTGWAQVNYPYGNSTTDAAVKLEYDLYYLKHRSMLFDAWIVVRTIPTVLRFKGM
jgi:exopolysaccharide biosynthesis polyprenyl glycosylphosphotransferase